MLIPFLIDVGNWEDLFQGLALLQLTTNWVDFPGCKTRSWATVFLLSVELSVKSSGLPSQLQLWPPSAGLISSVPLGVVFQLSECRLATLPSLS